MKNKKQVLVAENDKTLRTALTIVLQEMGIEVFEASDGLDAMEVVRDKEVDLIITNILLPHLSGVDLIKNAQAIHSRTEVIALSNIASDAVYERMRNLGVFRLFKVPFKIDEIKDAVLRGLSSVRDDRLLTEVPFPKEFMQDLLRIVVASEDIDIFQKILEIGLTARWPVDHAKGPDEFKSFLTIGFYDAIIISESFYKALDQKKIQPLIQSSCKPVLFILSDRPKPLKNRKVHFASQVTYLSESFDKQTFSGLLQNMIPEYLEAREKSSLERMRNKSRKVTSVSLFSRLRLPYKITLSPVHILYFLMILLAGLLGFWINSYMDQSLADENERSKIINDMQRYQEMQRLYDPRRK